MTWQAGSTMPAPVQAALPAASPADGRAASGIFSDLRIVAGLVIAGALLLLLAVVAVANFHPTPPEANKSPEQIFADSRAVMLITGSYHAHVASGKATDDVYYQGSAAIRQESTDGDRTVKLLQLQDNLYVSGNAAFYSREPVLAQHAADQWITGPPNAAILDPTANSPATGAECILARHGRLTRRGLDTVNGRRVVEVDDAGDTPGSTPARFYFAVDDGPTDLLRVVVTGPTHVGAFVDRCVRGFGIQSPTNRAGERIDILEINGTFDMTAPANPVKLGDRPFCGDPLNFDLPSEIQQYMLITYESNLVRARVEQECGCPTPTYASLRLAFSDDAAGADAFATSVQAMTLSTVNQRAARDRLVAAAREVARAERLAVATGQYVSDGLAAAWQADAVEASQFRSALGMGPSTCSFVRP